MDEVKQESIRTALEGERASIERQLQEHGAPADGDGVDVLVNEGFADSAQATTERSQLISMIEQLRSHHHLVVNALRRLDEGTYGKCERCGERIPPERLEALPTATLCVGCKQATGN
jgi:RNA polymerase-binding transcription factor DksA